MNALASAVEDVDLERCQVWSTQQPCSMCAAAIDFAGVPSVHFLATDPSNLPADGRYASSGASEDIWTVVANTLFLHNVAWVVGTDHPMLAINRRQEPDVVALALALLDGGALIDAGESGATVEEALTANWEAVLDASRRRLSRR
jgi:hypothetical protein